MTESKALIERLRQLSGNTGKMTWVGDKPMTARDALTRAADYIKKLEADNARLREALVEASDAIKWCAEGLCSPWDKHALNAEAKARAALAGDSHDQ